MLSKVVNFEAAIIPNVRETSISIDNVCDLGTIDCFPSRPTLKNFPITNGRKFVSKRYSYFSWLEFSIVLDRAFYLLVEISILAEHM